MEAAGEVDQEEVAGTAAAGVGVRVGSTDLTGSTVLTGSTTLIGSTILTDSTTFTGSFSVKAHLPKLGCN